MMINGAQILLECLKEQGVDTVFGYPGGTVLNIYDALYDEKNIRHILTCHEQGATHAADGYARATGKVGVVIATSGPGAANTVTGIATAFSDSVPLVVITGQVGRPLLGSSAFQEIDITSITKPITKKNYIVMDVESLADVIREAFDIARSGRPGPVLIDIPKDVQADLMEYTAKKINIGYKTFNSMVEESVISELEEKLLLAVAAIDKSKKPVIFAGGGVRISDASKELLAFAEKIKAPVACSLMGIGEFPGTHPQFMGMVGMHGSRCSNLAFTECDLLIGIGVRFSDRVLCNTDGFAPKAGIIQIDIDPAELGKNIDVEIPLCGDVKGVLAELTQKIELKDKTDWNKQIQDWKASHDIPYKSKGKLDPPYLFNKIYQILGDKAILTTEVGQHQMWAAQYFTYNEPRTLLTSGGLGTMGFGLGAAIGATLGRPDKKIINVAGDGSFKMNMNELATLKKYNIPMIQLVINNSALGMVRQWQRIFYNERFSHTTIEPDVDFQKLAAAFGIKSMMITSNEEIESVFEEALKLNEPVLIECIIDHDDLVIPMVPLGESISETVTDI